MYKKYYKTSNDLDIIFSKIPEKKLELQWEKIEYENSGDPKVWGPAFWFSLHNGSVKYPIKASPLWAERMKGFILGIPVMLPCEKCADHAMAHIESNYDKLDEIVSGRDKLFKFFVDMHNYVNRRYKKPEMSVEDAYKLYTSPVSVNKLTYK